MARDGTNPWRCKHLVRGDRKSTFRKIASGELGGRNIDTKSKCLTISKFYETGTTNMGSDLSGS